MRKHLMIFAVVFLAVAIAAPAFAAIEFKYGGQFRARVTAEDNVRDGIDAGDVFNPNAVPGFTAATTEQARGIALSNAGLAIPGPLPTLPGQVQTFQALKVPFTTFNHNDNRVFVDQRLRLYFTFLASKNLKVVTKFEVGDAVWGDGGGSTVGGLQAGQGGSRVGTNRGANLGADGVSVEVKNAYVEFNIPNTPSTGIVGVQTLTLLDSWIVDDDFPAAVLVTKLDPFKITLGYVGAQHGWEKKFIGSSEMPFTDNRFNVDSWFMSLDYASGPFKAALVGFFQDGHDSSISIDPSTMDTPVSDFTGGPALITSGQVDSVRAGFVGTSTLPGVPAGTIGTADVGKIDPFSSFTFLKNVSPRDNFLFDLGFNLTYKVDWLMAYVNFVKNFGSVDGVFHPNLASNAILNQSTIGQPSTFVGQTFLVPNQNINSVDYEGWMIDAGVTYYCGPYTLNVGGFYTTGPKFSNNPGPSIAPGSLVLDHNGNLRSAANGNLVTEDLGNGKDATSGGGNFVGMKSKNVDWFVYPGMTGKYFSEIVGGGILGDDIDTQRGFSTSVAASSVGKATSLSTLYWRGYHFPTNLWTITAGGSWQVMEKTKLSASYWYFGTAEDVPVAYTANNVTPVASALIPGLANGTGRFKMSSNIGHELNFYVDQGIVDGLTLTLVGAYLIADDAWAPIPLGAVSSNTQTTSVPNKASDAFELGARLQWNF